MKKSAEAARKTDHVQDVLTKKAEIDVALEDRLLHMHVDEELKKEKQVCTCVVQHRQSL